VTEFPSCFVGFEPEVVADQLDQEGIPLRGFGGLLDEAGRDADASLAEELAVRCGDFGDGGFVEIDPVGSPQEGGNAFIEEIRHGRREAGEDQADRQPVADEVLDVGGQLGDFCPADRVDLVDDDESCAFPIQPAQQFVLRPAPIGRPFRRELGSVRTLLRRRP